MTRPRGLGKEVDEVLQGSVILQEVVDVNLAGRRGRQAIELWCVGIARGAHASYIICTKYILHAIYMQFTIPETYNVQLHEQVYILYTRHE